MDLLEFDLQSFEIPKINLASMKLPDMPELFDLKEIPKIDIPKMPQIELPELPDMARFPGIDTQSIGGPSDEIVLPLVAAGFVGLIAALIVSGNSGKSDGGVSSAARKSMRKPR